METLNAAYQRLLAELVDDLHATCAIVERWTEASAAPAVIVSYGSPLVKPETLTWLALPVHEGEAELGRLRLGFVEGTSLPNADQLRVAQSLVELAVLLGHARWEQTTSSAHQASRRILAVTEEELQRIILNVHDGPVQKLFAASSQVEAMQSQVSRLPDSLREPFGAGLTRVDNLLQASLDEIKTTLGTLRPPEFRRRPLVSVIQGLIMQHEALTGVRVQLHVEEELPPVSLPVKIALYRIVQEALSNAYRHAAVDYLEVRLASKDGWVTLEVRDEGRGFEPPPLDGPSATEREEHIGLRGMRERAQLVGGQLHLTSRPGHGTRIEVKVPSDV